MKHPLRIVTVAALAVGTLLAFTASGGLAKPNQDLAAADPIVIAMPLALTGVISFYDQPNLAGAQIAVAEINKKGGVLNRPLKIISADTKSDLGLIAGVANSLLDQGADVMIPTLDYDFGGRSRGPQMRGRSRRSLLRGTPASVCRESASILSSTSFLPGSEAAIGGTWARSKGWRNAFVLGDPSISYSKTFTENFKYSWGKLGGKIAGEDTFMNSDQSIAAQITKLKALVDDNKVDFIFMGSYAPGGDCDEADPRGGDQPADHRRSGFRRDLLARSRAEPEELLRRRRRRHDRRRSEQAAGSRLPGLHEEVQDSSPARRTDG